MDQGTVIRTKLRAGTLPTTTPSQVWVGESRGESCDACDRPIVGGEIEYEAHVIGQGVFRFHRKCFEVWHRERLDHAMPRDGRPPSLVEALWQHLDTHRGQTFCARCLAGALGAAGRLDRAISIAQGRGARRRQGRCSMCGARRLVCGLAPS
jgi:hypothetical protein